MFRLGASRWAREVDRRYDVGTDRRRRQVDRGDPGLRVARRVGRVDRRPRSPRRRGRAAHRGPAASRSPRRSSRGPPRAPGPARRSPGRSRPSSAAAPSPSAAASPSGRCRCCPEPTIAAVSGWVIESAPRRRAETSPSPARTPRKRSPGAGRRPSACTRRRGRPGRRSSCLPSAPTALASHATLTHGSPRTALVLPALQISSSPRHSSPAMSAASSSDSVRPPLPEHERGGGRPVGHRVGEPDPPVARCGCRRARSRAARAQCAADVVGA